MPEGLKLVIGGDVKQAEQALKTLTKEVEQSASKIDSSFKKSFTSVNQSIAKVPAATRPALAAISKLGDNIETLRAKLLAKQSFLVTEKDIGKVAVLNAEIRELQAEIVRVGNVGKTGFDNLGNAVTKAGGQFGGLATGAQKSFSALRTLANIIPGIGIGGLVALLSEAVIGLFKTSAGFDEAAISAAKFSQAIKDAKTNLEDFFAGDIDLDKLKNKLRLGEGAALITENFKLDKGANDSIVKEANQQIDDAVDRIGHLRSNAAFFLSEKGRQLIDLFPDDAAIPDSLIDELSEQDKKVVQELKVQGTRLESLRKERDKAREKGNTLEIQSQLDLRDALKKEQDKRLDDLKKFIDKAKQLASELEKIGFIQPQFSFFDSVEEQLVKAKKVFADFNSRNLKIDPKFFKIEPTLSEPRPEQVQAALNSVEEGIRNGIIVPPKVPLEIEPSFSANALSNIGLLADKELARAFDIVKIPMANLIEFDKPAGFNFNVLIDTLRKSLGAAKDATREELIALANEFQKGIDAINKSILSLQIEGLAGLGEALGSALAGGDISNIFKGFATTVASGIQAIGKQFITLGAVAVAAKESLKTLFTNPFAAIAAGIALVAVGAALKSAIGGGVPGFAAGGLVFGPTLGLVGEGVGTSRSNPEVIAPLDQLKGMLSDMGGGGTQRVIVSGRLRGRDMALQNARTSRSQRRLGA